MEENNPIFEIAENQDFAQLLKNPFQYLFNFINYVFCVECPAIAFKCISYPNARNYHCCKTEVLEDQIDNLARCMNDVGLNSLDPEEFETDMDKDKLIWHLNMDLHEAVNICIDMMLDQKYRGIDFDASKAFTRIFKELYNTDLDALGDGLNGGISA